MLVIDCWIRLFAHENDPDVDDDAAAAAEATSPTGNCFAVYQTGSVRLVKKTAKISEWNLFNGETVLI